jgi:hypothetical protein
MNKIHSTIQALVRHTPIQRYNSHTDGIPKTTGMHSVGLKTYKPTNIFGFNIFATTMNFSCTGEHQLSKLITDKGGLV